MIRSTINNLSTPYKLGIEKRTVMRKILIIAMVMFTALTSCEKSNPVYTIEGKWIWSPSESRADANTMYEFIDGNIYTSYCITCPGDDDYWNSLDSSDRIPGVHSYSFDVGMEWYA